jgi:hypothetical protein
MSLFFYYDVGLKTDVYHSGSSGIRLTVILVFNQHSPFLLSSLMFFCLENATHVLSKKHLKIQSTLLPFIGFFSQSCPIEFLIKKIFFKPHPKPIV